MMKTLDTLIDDLAPFADLGAAPPRAAEVGEQTIVRFIRNGSPLDLTFAADGRVIENYENLSKAHSSFRSLLASPTFADLGRWADAQRIFLRERVEGETIPILGAISGNELGGDVSFFDDFLEDTWKGPLRPRSVIALIDGPAGIGKTSVIRSLAYRRADQYRRTQRPLILHVESRGRVLQNIVDLMAFSLQSLRLAVTYDQVPVLVRHGLISMAIDGFDELGDPNGYRLAWAQVNDLLVSARGQGTLILAGRETFISKARISSALSALDANIDKLEAFNLKPLSPHTARAWLATQGWENSSLDAQIVQPLFEEGSYALRPFFLSELARPGVQHEIINGEVEELLPFLVDAMVVREAGKFGRDIEAITTSEQREMFVRRLMEEVARDLAENQAASIQGETLAWLAEVVAEGVVPEALSGILKNRVGVIAFLTDDDRRGYKKFVHEHVYNFFLSKVTINSLSGGEISKFVRRNIIGPDFLEAFAEVCRGLEQTEVDDFIDTSVSAMDSIGDFDRARANIAALILSACCVTNPRNPPAISRVSLDEAYLSETVAELRLEQVVIGQLVARGADLRSVSFDTESAIASLIADNGTALPPSFPTPSVVSLTDNTLYDPQDIHAWLHDRMRASLWDSQIDWSAALAQLGPFSLLARISRYKPFWLKDGDEKAARRILDDPHWPLVKELLEKHELISERYDVPAAGRPSPFYHIKNRVGLMDLSEPAEEFYPFLQDLLQASVASRTG